MGADRNWEWTAQVSLDSSKDKTRSRNVDRLELTGSSTTGDKRSSIPSTSTSSSTSFFRWVEAEKIFTSSVPSSVLIRIVGSSLTDDEGEDERLDEGED